MNARIFASVFGSLVHESIPTPSATPVLGSNEFEESNEIDWTNSEIGGKAEEQIRWNQAWHVATTFLTLPYEPITAHHASQSEEALRGKWLKPCTPNVLKALSFVASRISPIPDDDIFLWYFQEIGNRHYVGCVMPGILEALEDKQHPNPLLNVLRILQVAQAIYLHPLKHHILPFLDQSAKRKGTKIRERLHSLIAESLPHKSYVELLGSFFHTQGCIRLGLSDIDGAGNDIGDTPSESPAIVGARQQTTMMIQGLQNVGLGGPQAQRVFAEIMYSLLNAHIKRAFAGRWASPSTVIKQLQDWVENRFARYVVEVLTCLKDGPADECGEKLDVSHADVERWQEMSINSLGVLRTSELFDVIIGWDQDSSGAIEDLKQVLVYTHARQNLTFFFSRVLLHRLLQPGASTIEIIQVYISTIRAFAVLDPKGVLLDRIARPIRRYLREREDTVSIIVKGLLADTDDEPSNTDALVLGELATELNKIGDVAGDDVRPDGHLDWDDMSWMPDPVDAGPEYQKSKNSDVIGSLISLFDNRDIFIKEFQKVMGERLLKREFDFEKETRVLELLKFRFGEAQLQACEVMLRDVLDSRRVDSAIREDELLHLDEQKQPAPELHARILSHLFWPSLVSESFSVPREITALQHRYSNGFESLKQTRKLTWLDALGQVTVQLDLEDRVVTEEVQTWQASVIYAFQQSDTAPFVMQPLDPSTKTVQQLMADLSMDEPLVRNALTFWVGKLVLKEVTPDTYTVLETLSDDDLSAEGSTAQAAIAAAADVATSATAPAIRSEEDVTKEKMDVFWQFVVGMLTNQGTMPLGRIVMMLKLVVPTGFPFGNEELKEFLEGKVQEGRLEVGGGGYKILH